MNPRIITIRNRKKRSSTIVEWIKYIIATLAEWIKWMIVTIPEWIQWIIATLIAVVSIFIGRYWGLHDRKRKKDQELLDKIKQALPSDGNTVSYLLKKHDFRTQYDSDYFKPLFSLERLLNIPDSFFLDRKLEKLRKNLSNKLRTFINIEKQYVFTSKGKPGYYEIASAEEIFQGMRSGMERPGELSDQDEFQETYRKAREQYENTAEKLNTAASELLAAYNKLLIKAHQVILPEK
jgi:hypothetical protein